ncbi:hypothetical protein ACFC6L_11735 [Kitasatospora phosalacinea]|uniref:hypothetical protein n=1 Tax=Kitasatospora phosalacinea TaxID=2065 RepID=UPI0035E049A2
MSGTTTRAAWLELLEGWGGECAGCTPEELDGLGVTGPEATSWYAFCAADEWFLDDFPVEPGTRLPLGSFSAAAAHPAQLAGAARAALARWAAGHR